MGDVSSGIYQRQAENQAEQSALPSARQASLSWEVPHPTHFGVREVQYVCPVLARLRTAEAAGGRLKRWFDVIGAACLLLLLAPLFLFVAAAIKASGRGPVFFRHRRVGQNGAEFYCLKFRTMAPDADARLRRHLAENTEAALEWAATRKLKNDPRVTILGSGLRKSSVDELPQLLNVLRGEMSLVGPRPIVREEVPKYGEFISEYISTRPGLTGLWQVSGRNDVDYANRVLLDSKYVREWNIWQDLIIIGKTVWVVLSARGSY